MKNGINLWLDDKRAMPEGYDLRVYTAQAAIAALETGTVEKMSLDHDLGPEWKTGNGYMVAKWVEEAAYLGKIPKLVWYIHSQNSVGVATIRLDMGLGRSSWLAFPLATEPLGPALPRVIRA